MTRSDVVVDSPRGREMAARCELISAQGELPSRQAICATDSTVASLRDAPHGTGGRPPRTSATCCPSTTFRPQDRSNDVFNDADGLYVDATGVRGDPAGFLGNATAGDRRCNVQFRRSRGLFGRRRDVFGGPERLGRVPQRLGERRVCAPTAFVTPVTAPCQVIPNEGV